SLTVFGNISGGRGTAFHIGASPTAANQDNGHLILPNANSYVGDTFIDQGWVTVQNNLSLGGFVYGGDTIQPTATVRAGAALHLKPRTPGASFNLIRNLVLSGDGISHNFGLINHKGALMSLGGLNTVGGPVDLNPGGQPNIRSSDIQLNGNAGIG